MAADLEFDTDVRRRIYEYVEQHGAVPYGEVRDAVRVEDDGSASKPTRSGAAPTVPLTPQAFADHVEALLDAGHLREEDGKLRVGVEAAPEPFELDDGTPATVRLAREADREGVLSVMDEVAAEGTSIVAETIAEVLDDDPLFRRSRHHSRVCFVATVGEAREEDETEAEVRAGDEGETEDQAPASEDTADADHGERGGEVVGWAHLDAPEFEKLRHTAELIVGVRPDHRGQGIGSRLLERGLEWADEQEYRKVYQSVPATNDAAVDFLEAHGWTVEATRGDHYLVDGEFVDEVMLATLVEDQ